MSTDATYEREWIIRRGVSNLHSLASILGRQEGLRFAGVNPAIIGTGGRSAMPGMWAVAFVEPTTLPRFWWLAVLEFGNGVVTVSPVPSPAECVVAVLRRMGVTETRFRVEEAEPTSIHPWLESRRAAVPDKRSVYFIQAGDDGLIKIGVAGNAYQRLAGLQTSSPVPLRLVAAISGVGQVREVELHKRFAHLRAHGEWFHPTPELLAYIAEVAR